MAYSVDLRELVVNYVRGGGSKAVISAAIEKDYPIPRDVERHVH